MAIVKVPNVGQAGIVLDLPAHELPINAWSGGLNVRFRDNCAERFKGQTQIFTSTSVSPYHIAPYQANGKRFWVHAGLSAVYADDGTTRTNITGTAPTGGVTDYWNSGSLNGVFVLNNGKDVPMFWGGTGTLASLTGWTAGMTAKIVRPFKNYLIALDIDKSGTRYRNMVKWSAAAVPGAIPTSWDHTDVTKDAGEIDLAEESSNIVDCLPLGDTNIIYKERAMFAQTFIGQPYIFRFQRLPGEVGMLTSNCAAITPMGHVVLCPGDVVLHSGQGPASIANAQVRRHIFSTIDSVNYGLSFVVANPSKNEVWVCYPEAGDSECTRAAVWNWIEKSWSFRELSAFRHAATGQVDYAGTDLWSSSSLGWDEEISLWNQTEFTPADARLLIVDANNKISMADAGTTFAGTAFGSYIERTGITLDDPQAIKTIRGIHPRFDAPNGAQIKVEIGASMDANRPPIWSAPMTFVVGSQTKVDGFATGRFLAVRFTALDNQPHRLKSYDMDVVISGAY
jgi:hypothetical protein